MADYLKLGANLMKGGNAAQMMKMMSGEMDMAGMIEMLPQLMEGGNVKDLLLKMAGSYLDSSPYGALIQQYGKQVTNILRNISLHDLSHLRPWTALQRQPSWTVLGV